MEYQWKTKNIFKSQKKYYLSDKLYTHLYNESLKLENYVYTYLIEKFGASTVFFLRDEKGQEVDFIVSYGQHFYWSQVCTDLNDENEKREFRSLFKLLKYRSDEEIMGDKYYLLYQRDSRLVKNIPKGIETKQILDFVLTE